MKRNILKLKKPASALFELPSMLRILLKDEAIGGKLILAASLLALIAANTSLLRVYEDFWHQNLSLGINDYTISLDLRHWVSEGLMALFFLVVGLEIKREIVKGQLRQFKTALLPIGAAIGGMLVPALIFLCFNHNDPEIMKGWAIPIATDIAFALGVMSLLGRRISSSLRVFLLTLAIVDDIGAIIIIALFYGSGFNPTPLLIALVISIGLWVCRNQRFMSLSVFVLLGIGLWVAVYESGVHPSITGAFLGFLAPLNSHKKAPVAERLERLTIPVSTFVVVPLFAFANLGIVLSTNNLYPGSLPLLWGIMAGLIIGKVVGITAASWLLVKLKLSELPHHTNWFQLMGVGFIAGIGFTVSIFITELAFGGNADLTNTAKIGIIIASTISAVSGYFFLRHRKKVEALLEG